MAKLCNIYNFESLLRKSTINEIDVLYFANEIKNMALGRDMLVREIHINFIHPITFKEFCPMDKYLIIYRTFFKGYLDNINLENTQIGTDKFKRDLFFDELILRFKYDKFLIERIYNDIPNIKNSGFILVIADCNNSTIPFGNDNYILDKDSLIEPNIFVL